MSDEVDLHGYRLEVYVDPDDGSWVAEVPDLPGCVAAAKSIAGAMERVEDAITAWIEAAHSDGAPVPPPSVEQDEYSGRFLLRLPRGLHRQLARQAKREGVSLNQYCSNALTQFVTIGQFSDALARHYPYDASLFLGPTNRVFTTTLYTGTAIVGESPLYRAGVFTVGNRGEAVAAGSGTKRAA